MIRLTSLHKSRGFTIVELLIVIVVIAILATIAIVSYAGIQDRAKATVIANGIKTTQEAMQLALLADKAREWWDDEDYLDENGEPAIASLIEGTSLKKYLPQVPKVGGDSSDNSFWMYDNDGPEDPDDHIYDPAVCPAGHRSNGVNIQIELNNNQRLAQQIDTILDDGNLECGHFREHHSNEGEFLWLLSSDYRKIN